MGNRGENRRHEPDDAKVRELAGAYLSALLSGNEVLAEIAIRDAMDAHLSTAEIDEKVIAPALWGVGELWEQGKLTVAEEHLATEISVRVLALQREAQRVAQSRNRWCVMLATPAGELHVVALRMVANLLRGSGYEIVMLGPDVPTADLGATARLHEPAVVCLSATMPEGTDQLLGAIDEVHERLPSTGVVVGGRALTIEEHLRPGVRVCRSVTEAVDAVDAVVKRASLN